MNLIRPLFVATCLTALLLAGCAPDHSMFKPETTAPNATGAVPETRALQPTPKPY